MTCDRCKETVPLVVHCAINLIVGGNVGTVRSFSVCPECANEIRPLLEAAIGDTILDK
jgi:hypothetical protein